ncbi:hypothetical protein B9Z19DRAFT_1138316 [Tuber borchii]|uniref:Uncharacterized protein n=1 Tax=Tuber borchii TaxID=42251 RepID=A0A2T6ZA23_TUBBO|nr:hypothetical protein B9Z19DRAFT_1138316 [Tuber borchii]
MPQGNDADFIAIEGSPLTCLVTLVVGLLLHTADEWTRHLLDRPAQLQHRLDDQERRLERLEQQFADLKEEFAALQQLVANMRVIVDEVSDLRSSLEELIHDCDALRNLLAEI